MFNINTWLAVLLIWEIEKIPSVTVRTEHHAAVFSDVDDAVFSLDGHPTQLDVLRVG